MITRRQFVCFFHFNSWAHISFGFHIDIQSPNIEIHVPGGFFRIGWQGFNENQRPITFGKDYKL